MTAIVRVAWRSPNSHRGTVVAAVSGQQPFTGARGPVHCWVSSDDQADVGGATDEGRDPWLAAVAISTLSAVSVGREDQGGVSDGATSAPVRLTTPTTRTTPTAIARAMWCLTTTW